MSVSGSRVMLSRMMNLMGMVFISWLVLGGVKFLIEGLTCALHNHAVASWCCDDVELRQYPHLTWVERYWCSEMDRCERVGCSIWRTGPTVWFVVSWENHRLMLSLMMWFSIEILPS